MSQKKQEVYFLPFRASMWKSMESVWISMQSNSDCHVHVMPIPYFDRDEEGNRRNSYYEGEQFPDYVPVEDYREADFEQLHPDIICIQYPFDDQNIRNGIDQRFFARTLRLQTDMLIYIPYFTEMEEMPQAFCTCPAVEHANRVILQSKTGREIYMVHYHDYMIERGIADHEHLDRKFLVQGEETRTEYSSSVLPASWEKQILEDNGVRRKVILYGTTVKAFRNSPEQMLKKIESVLREFSDRDNDVVLWWRPEPALEETIADYSEEMLAHFKELVSGFKESGIYDDTMDLNRAICESDAYYGDWCSIVPLYESAGKPVMIQDVSILEAALA
ncbi:MAG: hypothetical protein K6G23_11055, partial [Lachnospiraceae bacterium]|nr:hypothetical protein [Lachnospiraceae bacterium]